MHSTSKVLELIVFTLNDGVSRQQMLATVDPVSEWARRQPGFISRKLAHDGGRLRLLEALPPDDMESTLMIHGGVAATA